MNKLAQIDFGQLRGKGPLGLEGREAGESVTLFNSFISGAIGLMTVIAMVWFTINFILGAIGIITAGGDKGKLEASRNKITTGIIGIIVVIASIFIIQAIGSLLGIGDVILNPTSIINEITPGGGQ